MRHSDKIILQKIIKIVELALKILGDISKQDFLLNEEKQHSLTMTIIRIGELVKNLSPEFRNENKQIAWREIAGFRDVAAHSYDTLRMKDVYDTIKKDFPELKLQIEKIFDIKE